MVAARLCIAALLLFAGFVRVALAEPSIKMSVESDEVYLGDTVLVVIESIGLIDPLDVSILSKAARFVRETTGTRIYVQKGKVVEVKLRRMEFIPEKTGPVIFGPVTAGDVTSNSVALTVLDQIRSDWEPSEEDISVSVHLSNPAPYLYSQVVLDIVLRHRYAITDETITLPDLHGFSKRTVYEQRRTFTSDSQEWKQISWRYLLFPVRSENLEIGPVTWSGTTIKSRPERADFKRSSNPVIVNVAPSQTESGQWWLPTSELSLSETWSTEVTSLRAGDEVLRTIRITAKDVLAGQIPAPAVLESRALSQTLINTDRSEQISTNGIFATAEFVFRVKAQSPIPVFLDTVRQVWWNTQTDEAAEAIIPARRINVGLPDRADLLKKLAVTDIGMSRFDQWWAGASGFRIVVYGVAALSLFPIILFAIRGCAGWLICRYQARRKRQELLQLANSGDLAKLADALLPYFDDPYTNRDTAILGRVQAAVYGGEAALPESQEINRYIQDLDLTPLKNGSRPDVLVQL